MSKRREKLSGQIRRIIADCGMTRYAIAQATGIDNATLSRFMSGERGMSMQSLDMLADLLKLDIVVRKVPKPKGR